MGSDVGSIVTHITQLNTDSGHVARARACLGTEPGPDVLT